MHDFLDSFSTREIAISIWLIITFITCLFSKNIRQSLGEVFKALFAWKISASLFAFYLHTSFYIFLLYKLGFWNISLLKDTIIWSLSFGFVSLMNINKVDDTKYFKNVFLDAIKWTIAIEFIINFFTFSLIKEIILVPTIVLSTTLQAFASLDPKHKQVENLFKNLLMYFLIFIFLFSLFKTIEKYHDVFTIESLKIFLLPVILTITFLPFMYLYNLFVKYEILWVRLNFMIKNDTERNRVKRHILIIANFDINKLVNISKNIAKPINVYNDFSRNMIKHISKEQYIGYDE
ncbi:hypothetical protein MKI79_06425 [Acinetobacter sp. A3.8]|uniref:Uncharacterized protein n=1 Tax=Acinetobacter sedimenti TaxID=2919922 RepID=A0A9X1WZ68_9GAMM|nr:hypothetical protein [Acinetobacter sedimenti]MCJ8146537.1 hypothetical protein [Acinetobacter sedimenti]